ncbi:HDIG domain-containing protein [Candidatus Aerophobetes bacterium]|uniref:HDIG domain-containing protein n=1 Tax=Aerophobetes bacterium TaxID=2030807 RepID=A0A523QI31_UNCAE|nr:MAG: HDIG domain-containing protein [Candidatus Aerophobetes bacterium]
MSVTKERLNKLEIEKGKESLALKGLFSEEYGWRWVWALALVGILSLIFLFPPTSGVSLVSQAGVVILIGILIVLLLVYLSRYWPQFLSPKLLLLLGILTASMGLMGRIIILLPQIPYVFIPIAFLSILISLLFAPSLSTVMTVWLSIYFALNARSLQILPVLVIGGMVGIYSAQFVRQRTDLTKGGIYVGLANGLTILAVGLLYNQSFSEVGSMILWGIGSGLFSSILVMTILPYLETYFGLITDIKLLELSNLNLPLLKRLSIEAPGTYHHTLMVANLAEAGAEIIGANSLLTRVGAYYHDIGKIVRPHFFFENSSLTEDDRHGKVSPNLSSTIIISHVKDGVEMAQKDRLPPAVIDIIREHHGKSLIAYFYRKALKNSTPDRKGEIDEDVFRYPGPLPESKETALVMLADSVEAAFRFSPQKTVKSIEAQTEKVINNKLKDRQLDRCDLTLREIKKIAEAFTRILAGLVHTRGRYPEEILKGETALD